MREEENGRLRGDSDLVLPPKMFAYVLDRTKGNVTTFCGPQKTSLSQTDQPVIYDNKTSRFKNVGLDAALQTDLAARQGEYIVLNNTAKGGKHPTAAQSSTMDNELIEVGKTENIPGPISFPLWPGQVAEVVKGHHLRSNQYLLVRVYDEDEAKKNWSEAVIKKAKGSGDSPTAKSSITGSGFDVSSLTMGKLLLVKGTDISFYMPPTGVEVVKEEGQYVRNACTLERLEYCILLEENGDKRYVRGPDVVFPTPTEQFVTDDQGDPKSRAYELNENSGLYIKVIAKYEEEGKQFNPGDELFITGKDMPIYFPRMEHAIINYGKKEKHYAVAIPKGEARYVLSRNEGEVRLQKGPAMFLPNPINDVIVKKVLDKNIVELYYPGNEEAKSFNRNLEAQKADSNDDWVTDSMRSHSTYESLDSSVAGLLDGRSTRKGMSETLTRGTSFTPPRSLTLDTKYDGAVTVCPWTGYAIQIVNKSGERRIVEGPNTILLEYDEQLEKLALSTSTPKSNKRVKNTVYLRTMSNPVSDIVTVKTSDLVDVQVKMKYLVRFTGDNSKWFSVENYVQYLCDHIRSMVSNYVRSVEVTDFYENAAEHLRDLILGVPVTTDKDSKAVRPNRLFEENNMEIYDVEVIDVEVLDEEVAELLSNAKRRILETQVEVETSQAELELVKVLESVRRIKTQETHTTQELIHKLTTELEESVEKAKASHEKLVQKRFKTAEEASKTKAEVTALIEDIERVTEKADADLKEIYVITAANRAIELLEKTAATDVALAKAIQPQLIEAITALAQTGLMEKISGDLAPLAIVQGESVAGVLNKLLKGTPLEKVLDNVQNMGVRKAS